MDLRAIEKAETRLIGARSALEFMKLSNNYRSFKAHWYAFLSAWKSVYTVLEQGAKASAASDTWYKDKKLECRGDPLLLYLYESRNDDEHSLADPTKFEPGSLAIGVAKEGYSNAVRLISMEDGVIKYESMDGKPVLNEVALPHAVLVPVTARNGQVLSTPASHFGTNLANPSPEEVADMGMIYIEKLVAEARSFGP